MLSASIRTTLTGLVAAAILASLPAAVHAQEPTTNNLRPGKSVLLFHNIDFVGVFGYAPGSPVRVEVVRAGHVVGAVTAAAVVTAEGPGLEVNHGPVGTARPGDCWENFTPDVRPRDKIVVTGDGGQDVVFVDDIEITRGAYSPSADELAADASLRADDVVIEGHARYADGTPIAISALDSAEVRGDAGKTRAAPNVPLVRLGMDGWRAIYRAPGYGIFRGTGDRFSLLAGDHAIGYGHAPVPPPPVAQLVEGVGSGGGPAPGCEHVPAAPASAVTTLSDHVVNIASGDLTVSGVADGGVQEVVVTLDAGPGGRGPLVVPVPGDRLAGAPAAQAWSVDVSREQLERLADGTLDVTAAFDGGAANTITIAKDVVAPAPIEATPAPGTYSERQFVTLTTGDSGDRIRYTRNGTAPTPASLEAGGSISVSTSQTLAALATDAVGNAGAVKAFAYTIQPAADAANGSAPSSPTAIGEAWSPEGPASLGGPAPATVTTSSSASQARLQSLVTPARVKRSKAAREGLRLVMRLGAGSEVVQIRVYRRTGSRRSLIYSILRAPGRRRLLRIGLRNGTLRRALRAGRYEIHVTPGTSRTQLGRTSTVRLQIVQ
ncbi:hypothetical protein BH20ACT16_BH20ACT16_02560 [soil metagenome]